MDIKELGRIIKEARKAAGYTQETFAKEVGTTKSRISNVENGTDNLCFDRMKAILDKLNLQLFVRAKK